MREQGDTSETVESAAPVKTSSEVALVTPAKASFRDGREARKPGIPDGTMQGNLGIRVRIFDAPRNDGWL